MNSTRQQKKISDEYRVMDVLGEGGMGRVYRALQTSRNRIVALKVLTSATSDQRALQRACNEANIQKGLRHPNIVEFYEQVDWEGRPCLVMEYVNGVTLATRLKESGALPLKQALTIFSQIVSAVAYIHDHDIIHRDIKSANIRLTAEGQAKLLDFGIAKNDFSPHLTQTGFVIGTVEYLSPEQINSGKADARSDIWALGILLYEMLTGRVPFAAKTFGTLYQQINRASFTLPPELRLPRSIAKLIARCLKKDPTDHAITQCEAESTTRTFTAFARAAQQASRGLGLPPLTRPQSGRRLLLLTTLLVVLLIAWKYPDNWFNDANHSIRIEPADGPAELYVNGRFVDTTPFDLPARVGESLSFELRRNGHSKSVRFLVTSNMKSWSEPLQTGF
jgi:eukaryotic-like serine/threonine-protein kinase